MNTKKNHAVAFTGHRHSKLQKDAQNNPTFYEELQNEIVCYHNPNRTNPRSGTLYTLNRATKYGHTTINLCPPPPPTLPLKT